VVPGREPWWLVIAVGALYALLYYSVFSFAIKKFDLPTPGREKSEAKLNGASIPISTPKTSETLPYDVLEALGGRKNLAKLDACITRLRVSVKDVSKVNKERLRALGASGIMQVDKNLQIIFGTKSEKIKEQIADILKGERSDMSPSEDEQLGEERSISGKDMVIAMPMSGKLIPISEVPDKTFSEKILGDGFAILPKDGTVVSPTDGKVAVFFPTKHAIGIVADNGLEMLIHVGIDTVKLNGEGFEAFVKQGDVVKRGQVLLKADLEYISKNATSTISPIIFTNLSSDERIEIIEERDVKIGEMGCVRIIKSQPVATGNIKL